MFASLSGRVQTFPGAEDRTRVGRVLRHAGSKALRKLCARRRVPHSPPFPSRCITLTTYDAHPGRVLFPSGKSTPAAGLRFRAASPRFVASASFLIRARPYVGNKGDMRVHHIFGLDFKIEL